MAKMLTKRYADKIASGAKRFGNAAGLVTKAIARVATEPFTGAYLKRTMKDTDARLSQEAANDRERMAGLRGRYPTTSK